MRKDSGATRRLHVLVMDDEEPSRTSLETILRDHFVVATASTIAEARRAIDSGTFDAIVADYQLPDGTGAELLQDLRRRNVGIAKILLTGHADYGAVRELQGSGEFVVLFKPADPGQLIAWIRSEARAVVRPCPERGTSRGAAGRPAGFDAFAKTVLEATAADFARANPHPFLFQLTEPAREFDGAETAHAPANTQVIRLDRPVEPGLMTPLHVHPVRRRDREMTIPMVTLGRGPDNDIVLPYSVVSSFHASFVRQSDGAWTITDCSRYGTVLDAIPLVKRRPHTLRSGSVITIGDALHFAWVLPDEVHALVSRTRSRG